MVITILISIISIIPAGLHAEPEPKQSRATVDECLDYGAAFLAQGEYDNGKAWIDYGLKVHQDDPRLGIAQQSMRLLRAKMEERENIISSIKELMSNAGISKPEEPLKTVLVYSGFYLHQMSVDGFIIIDKVVYEMQESPIDIFFVGFVKKPLKAPERNDIKIKAKNEWTAYILLRNNSDIDFTRKNEAKLILETQSTPPAQEGLEGMDPGAMPMPDMRGAFPADTAQKGTERKSAPRTSRSAPATETMPEQPGVPQDNAPVDDPVSRNNESMHYEVDLAVGPKEFKRIVLDKPVFFLDDELKPEGYTITVSWVQNKDPYTCQAFTDAVTVTEDQVEVRSDEKK